MATWTAIETITGVFARQCASDGVDLIWFYNDFQTIKEYKISTDTVTTISNSASFDSGVPNGVLDQNLTYFNGKLYFGCVRQFFSGGTQNYIQAYEYNGTTPLTGWTKVLDSFMGAGVSASIASIYSNSTGMVIISNKGSDHYTANGASWSAGSLGTFAATTPSSNRNGTQLGIFVNFNTASTKKYDGAGAWGEVEAATTYYKTSGPDNHWRVNGSNRDYTPSFSSAWATPATSITALASQINMVADVAVRRDGGNDIYLHLFDGSDWDAGELVVNNSSYTLSDNPIVTAVVMLDDGNAYICFTSGTDVVIYERSEPYVITPPPSSTEVRYLGMTADPQYLYVTGLEDGILTLYTVDHETLTKTAVATFGAASFAEVDARARGLYPAHTWFEEVVLLRGRDGSDVAAQVSTDSGATFGTLDDVSWDAAAYLVALLVDPLTPGFYGYKDLIAVFSNDDIYRTEDGGESWTKINDAPATLRTAARYLMNDTHLLLAEETAGDLQFTNNVGQTFVAVGDGSIGVVNAIEWVYSE